MAALLLCINSNLLACSCSASMQKSLVASFGKVQSSTNIAKRSITLFVKIENVGISLPYSLPGGMIPSNVTDKAHQQYLDRVSQSNTVLFVFLRSLSLSGNLDNSSRTSDTGPTTKRLIAKCTIDKLSVGFNELDKSQELSLHNQRIFTPSSMNYANIKRSQCELCLQISKHAVVTSLDVESDGLGLKGNSNLYSHIALLHQNIAHGQSKWQDITNFKPESSTPTPAPPTAPAKSTTNDADTPSKFELHLKAKTKPGAIEFYSTKRTKPSHDASDITGHVRNDLCNCSLLTL